jgi:hypothetical protein
VSGFDGYLRRFNPAFVVFGYSREELVLENRVICRDGSARWMSWSTRVVPEEPSSIPPAAT